ncbi:MAG TPA: LacI family DNA-binding transcriptional regulator [Vicinamibacteria bacterium]
MRSKAPRPGSIGITIRDIARQAGVSPSTVSRVLNNSVPVADAKRQAVLDVVEAMGFRPNTVAQELARGHSQAIGVLPQGIANPFYSQVLKGVEQGLRGSGYYPLFASGEREPEEQEALEQLLAHRVDALILIGGHLQDVDLARLAQRLPLVAVGRAIAGLEHRCMRVENGQGGYEATRHLLDCGHTRIAHITGLPRHPDAIARREGYERALREAGLPPDPALVIEGDFEEPSGLEAVERLLRTGVAFTAIFAGNDRMAYGAGLALLRRGLQVPRDVSLVGFDDQPSAAYAWPPLTTLRQPTVEMGLAAARALVDELQGRELVLPAFRTELVRRESTGPPPR